jgi:hypothetical protein
MAKSSNIRKVNEETYIKVIVNLKCLGYVPKILRGFTSKEREFIFDELINRGWLDEHLNVLPVTQDIVTSHLHYCMK